MRGVRERREGRERRVEGRGRKENDRRKEEMGSMKRQRGEEEGGWKMRWQLWGKGEGLGCEREVRGGKEGGMGRK